MSKKKFFCLNDNGIFPINFFNVFFYVLQKNDLITKRIKSNLIQEYQKLISKSF